ncbi:GntR family transcriptional regulator [Spiribacter halobius]|uniref:GntR family transcriptional regulator n=1 Tax=Sediminicurvatus halobius TaxID=2182432 RepID=A0A2U2N174_9GAMM|nr:GntR family transcriptional regulator [Spiribacter halobius]PWG62724.1 GntR family transcriptional regulator [Spiribacter halobius]UEX77393.1 GntR family transcriptional regulator [Spiribacter halobius]
MRIVKSSLHEACADRIREQINAGVLLPGTRIPERDLCEQFGVSRTPLREALKALAAEGWVELTPHRGACVTRLDRADIENAFEIMAALESLAGRLACERIRDDELAGIRALHQEMCAHYESGELPQYFRCNQRIHEAIIDAARNPELRRLYDSLSGRLQRARYTANLTRQRWSTAVQEHERILEALTARNADRLSRLLAEHLQHKLEAVCEANFVNDTEQDGGVDRTHRYSGSH